jgi:hypothetical protein
MSLQISSAETAGFSYNEFADPDGCVFSAAVGRPGLLANQATLFIWRAACR